MGSDKDGLAGRQLEGGTRGADLGAAGVERGAARRDTVR